MGFSIAAYFAKVLFLFFILNFFYVFMHLFFFALNSTLNFLTSSAIGKFSGSTPLFLSIFRTSKLLSTCSCVISLSPFKFLSITLWLVNSVAKSFALIVNVGRKSARGRPSGVCKILFISLAVFPPNSAWSPLERIMAKLRSSTPLS
jgi:hypothetical protein